MTKSEYLIASLLDEAHGKGFAVAILRPQTKADDSEQFDLLTNRGFKLNLLDGIYYRQEVTAPKEA